MEIGIDRVQLSQSSQAQAAADNSGVSFSQVQAQTQTGQTFQQNSGAAGNRAEQVNGSSSADVFEEIADQALEIAEQRRQARLDQALDQKNQGRNVPGGSIINLLV